MIECRTMASAERIDAFELMQRFRSDHAALGEALTLFIDRPDYGFLWLAYEDDLPTACISVGLGIDVEVGGLVATARDLYVVPDKRRRGIGSALLATLNGRLAHLEVKRIDVITGDDLTVIPFFAARGYRATGIVFTHRR